MNRLTRDPQRVRLSNDSRLIDHKTGHRQRKRGCQKCITLQTVVVLYCAILFTILYKSHQTLHERSLTTSILLVSSSQHGADSSIVIASLIGSSYGDHRSFAPPAYPPLSSIDADYNNLEIGLSKYFQRSIASQDDKAYGSVREKALRDMDYAPDGLDDCYLNNEDVDANETCRRNRWQTQQYPNCNTLHEVTTIHRPHPSLLQDYNVSYKGRGTFRITWLFERADLDTEFIIKFLRYGSVFGHKRFYDMHQEAIIMERLLGSPRIVDIYGFCGASIMGEHMHQEITPLMVPGAGVEWLNSGGYITQAKLDELQKEDILPMNSKVLSLEQKLDLAIVMAESIAEIHGFAEGSIVHGDIHPVQWLLSKSGHLKLNDFNNGQIQLFNEETNSYCPIYRCYGGPQFRPPEEIGCEYADETIDSYAMGMTMYTLLTGLWPYYQYGKNQDKLIKKKLLEEGELPFVDARYRNRNHSLVESGLVTIIEGCWKAPVNRSSIFKVVEQLYELRDVYHRQTADTIKGDSSPQRIDMKI